MQQADYWIIVIFSIVIIVAGVSFGKKGGDMKSFFAAGGAVPWPVNGLSLFMSFFSAGTFVVWGSIAYEKGLVAIVIQWTMCISGFAVGYFIAPKWRETQALTAAEFINKRFGITVQQFYTYLFLILSLGYTGAFLYPVAKLVNVSTGFDINTSIIFLGLLIMAYTAIGGLWAVIVTDVLQFVILTAAVLVVLPLAISEVNGLDAFVSQAPEGFFNVFSGEYTLGFMIAFTFYNSIFIGGSWAYVQRYTSVTNAKSAKKVGYLFGALYLVSPLVWMLPPMLYRIINPDLTGLQTEGAYLLMCKEVLPMGMLGLMLGGMIFATASSVNTSLNLAAAVITNDVYKNFFPTASSKQLMFVARMSTFLFGIGTIIIALLVPLAGGIVEVVLSIGAVTGGSLYGPAIWGLFSKRQTGKSILWITLTGLSINIFFKFLSPLLFTIILDRSEEMMMGVFTPLILLAFYELYALTKNKYSNQYFKFEEFQTKSLTQAALDGPDQGAEAQNTYGMKVMAFALFSIGIIFMLLSFIGENGTWMLIIMGFTIISISIIMFRYSYNTRKEKIKSEKVSI